MATSLLYLGPYLSPCSILVTASPGGVCVYSCCSYCGCCGVARAVIKVASSTAIGTTCGAAVGIAGGISGAVYRGSCGHSYRGYYWWVGILCTDLACCAGCLGAVRVSGDVLALKWDGACADRACLNGACLDGACTDGVYTDGACMDGAYIDGAYADEACTDKA